MKGLLWELPPAGVSMAVRLARLPDLETRLPMMLEGRLLEDMVDCRHGLDFGLGLVKHNSYGTDTLK